MPEPAALQIAQLNTELMRATNSFNNNIEVFGNIANSIKSLNTMFSSSKIFKRNNVKTISNFFKTAPNLYRRLISGIDNLNKSISKRETTNIHQPNTEEMFPVTGLVDRIGVLSNNIFDLKNSVEDVKLDVSSDSAGNIKSLQTDLNQLNNEMVDIINQITSSSQGINGAASEVSNLNNDLQNTVEQFSNIADEGRISSQSYFEIIRRLNDVNARLSVSQRNLNNVNSDLSDTVNDQADAVDNLDRGISSMVTLQALDLFQGSQVGEVEDQISSLHDELIDLRKTMGDVSLPIKDWRRSAIDTAKEFNNLGIATDPAEMAHLYSVVGKAGVKTAKDVKSLAKSIKLITEATDISAEEAAEFGHVLADSWGLGTDYVDRFNSMVVKMQSLHNISANKIIDQTKDIGESFLPVLDNLGKKGREVFMVKLTSALGSLESAFIKDKSLIEDISLSLSDPAQAAEKFADILQGTGYSVTQMARDLKRGDITGILEKVFQGSSKFANMSTEQLRIVSERSGKSIADLVKMSKQSGQVIRNLTKLQTEGIEEISKGGVNTLTKLAVEENKKLGSLFERIGKRIKTWISDIGIGAIENLGVELLDLAPTLAPVFIVLDKLGVRLSGIGDIGKNVGTKLKDYGTSVFKYVKDSGGFIKSITRVISTARAGIISLGTSLYVALGPVGLIIAGITALTVGIIALIKYKDEVTNWLGKWFPNAAAVLNKALTGIANVFKELWDIAFPIIKMMGKIIGTVLVKSFEVLWSIGKVCFKSLKIGFMLLWGIAEPIVNLIGEAFSWLWSKISPEDAMDKSDFKGWMKGAELLVGVIKIAGNIIINFFDTISKGLDFIINDFDGFKTLVKSWFIDSIKDIISFSMKVPSLVLDFFGYIGKKLIKLASNTVGFLYSTFTNIFKAIFSIPIGDYIKSFVGTVFDKVISFKDRIIEVIGEIPNKIVTSVKESFSFLMDKVGSIVGKIADKVKKLPGIKWITSLFSGDKKIEGKARGGLVTKPSIVGEKGPEWIIPTYSPDRERFFKDVGKPLERDFIKTFTKEIPMVADGSKVVEPVIEKKIFTEKPESTVNVEVQKDDNQKDVVDAIKELTSVIKNEYKKSGSNKVFSVRKAKEPDEQAEIVRQWSM